MLRAALPRAGPLAAAAPPPPFPVARRPLGLAWRRATARPDPPRGSAASPFPSSFPNPALRSEPLPTADGSGRGRGRRAAADRWLAPPGAERAGAERSNCRLGAANRSGEEAAGLGGGGAAQAGGSTSAVPTPLP